MIGCSEQISPRLPPVTPARSCDFRSGPGAPQPDRRLLRGRRLAFFTPLLQNTEAAPKGMRWRRQERGWLITVAENTPLLQEHRKTGAAHGRASPGAAAHLCLRCFCTSSSSSSSFFFLSLPSWLHLCRRQPWRRMRARPANRRRAGINKNIKRGRLLSDCCVRLCTSLHHYGLFSLQIKPETVQISRRLKSF